MSNKAPNLHDHQDDSLPSALPERSEAHQKLFDIYCVDAAANGAGCIALDLTEQELQEELRARGLLGSTGQPVLPDWVKEIFAKRA